MFRKCPSYRAYLISWRDVRMLNSERDGLSHGDNISVKGEALHKGTHALCERTKWRDHQKQLSAIGRPVLGSPVLNSTKSTRAPQRPGQLSRNLGALACWQSGTRRRESWGWRRPCKSSGSSTFSFAGWEICSISLCGTCIRPGEILPDVVSLLQELPTIISPGAALIVVVHPSGRSFKWLADSLGHDVKARPMACGVDAHAQLRTRRHR